MRVYIYLCTTESKAEQITFDEAVIWLASTRESFVTPEIIEQTETEIKSAVSGTTFQIENWQYTGVLQVLDINT